MTDSDDEMHFPAVPQRRYCAVTFVEDGNPLGEGSADACAPGGVGAAAVVKLKRCTRCRCTYYASREAQAQHWPVHKKVCRPAEEFSGERERIFGMSAEDASNYLRDELRGQRLLPSRTVGVHLFEFVPLGPRVGYIYLWVLQRLEQLAKDGDDSNYAPFPGYNFFMGISNSDIELLWAVPGMADYLLNLDIRSNESREILYLQFDDEDDADPGISYPSFAALEADGFRPNFQVCNDFCDLVGSILTGSAFSDNSFADTSTTTDAPSLRMQLPIARAAARKVMQWCSDPWSLASIPKGCGDKRRGVRETKFMVLLGLLFANTHFGNFRPEEITIGLTVEGAVETLLNFIASAHYYLRPSSFARMVKQLYLLRVNRPSAWDSFTIERRAHWATFIWLWFVAGKGVEGMTPFFKECSRYLMGFVLGWNIDNTMWLKVVKEIERNDNLLEREFFQEWHTKVLKDMLPPVRFAFQCANVDLPEVIELLLCEYLLPMKSDLQLDRLEELSNEPQER